MCPGQNESAGKRKSAKTRKGSRWLRTVLLECAHAAGRSQGTYLAERYRQLARRRGKKKALVAIGHDILVTAYQLLATDQLYQEAGPERVKNEAKTLPSVEPSASSRPSGIECLSHPSPERPREAHRSFSESSSVTAGASSSG